MLFSGDLISDSINGMKHVKEIQGVYDEDLPGLLKDLGLKEDFDNGSIRCAYSDEVVTKDNFLCIFSDGKEIKFVCNNQLARTKFAEWRGTKNHG